jgi:oligopeptide/dipeptide ABC transporter ATP-binding protein
MSFAAANEAVPVADANSRGTRERSVLLEVRDLSVEFATSSGGLHAVRKVSFDVRRGETLAIVGESGCGKSTCVQALTGLIATPPGRISGSAKLSGHELVGLTEHELNAIRGARVGMIFQDPMASLNPTMRVGEQIAEALRAHRRISRTAAQERAVQLLGRMRITDPAARAQQYPFELSGGMAQRAMIAVSVVCEPELLIADEPTTALDATIQEQVLELLEELERGTGMAIVLITHDLGVVARMADRVAIMYAGEIVEVGSVEEIFYRSAHPYTAALKAALPRADQPRRSRLRAIEGAPPGLLRTLKGCSFLERCPHAMELCSIRAPDPQAVAPGHTARCWLHHPRAPRTPDIHQPLSA